MKKIAIDCRLLGYKNTGIARYIHNLVKYYKTKLHLFDIILIVNNNQSIDYQCLNYVQTRLKPYSIFDFLFYPFLVRKLGVNIIHCPTYSGLLYKLSDVACILTVHDLMYKIVPNFFSNYEFINKTAIAYYEFIVRASIRNSDRVIAVSRTTASDLRDYYKVEAVVIPENSQIISQPDHEIIGKFNLIPKNFFLYCGNARQHKNLDFVKSVFIKNNDLPTLVLAGFGHSSTNNVVALGVVTDEELRSLYENCIGFVFPSKYEGFGLPVLEALHCGTQVVASNIPAFKEFDSPSIHYFELNDIKSFVKGLNSAQHQPKPTNRLFFKPYSDNQIHKLMDGLLSRL